MSAGVSDPARVLAELRLSVLQRGWLSSNNVVLRPDGGGPVTVVDTGYDTHSDQTVALLEASAGAAGVGLIVNTHLHSDHCGGNAALQARWGCEAWVPEVSLDAVQSWDQERLTYALTDQQCRRFMARRGVGFDERLELAGQHWRALHAPGHDPEAMMLWHPDARVLIAGDALWEARLAIIFPELDGRSGFAEAREVLDAIEALDPAVVIPGHGAPFSGVSAALAASRARLAQFEAEPARHLVYAARALVMFHMLEQRCRSRSDLERWLTRTPVFLSLLERLGQGDAAAAASQVVQRLVADGLLQKSAAGELCTG